MENRKHLHISSTTGSENRIRSAMPHTGLVNQNSGMLPTGLENQNNWNSNASLSYSRTSRSFSSFCLSNVHQRPRIRPYAIQPPRYPVFPGYVPRISSPGYEKTGLQPNQNRPSHPLKIPARSSLHFADSQSIRLQRKVRISDAEGVASQTSYFNIASLHNEYRNLLASVETVTTPSHQSFHHLDAHNNYDYFHRQVYVTPDVSVGSTAAQATTRGINQPGGLCSAAPRQPGTPGHSRSRSKSSANTKVCSSDPVYTSAQISLSSTVALSACAPVSAFPPTLVQLQAPSQNQSTKPEPTLSQQFSAALTLNANSSLASPTNTETLSSVPQILFPKFSLSPESRVEANIDTGLLVEEERQALQASPPPNDDNSDGELFFDFDQEFSCLSSSSPRRLPVFEDLTAEKSVKLAEDIDIIPSPQQSWADRTDRIEFTEDIDVIPSPEHYWADSDVNSNSDVNSVWSCSDALFGTDLESDKSENGWSSSEKDDIHDSSEFDIKVFTSILSVLEEQSEAETSTRNCKIHPLPSDHRFQKSSVVSTVVPADFNTRGGRTQALESSANRCPELVRNTALEQPELDHNTVSAKEDLVNVHSERGLTMPRTELEAVGDSVSENECVNQQEDRMEVDQPGESEANVVIVHDETGMCLGPRVVLNDLLIPYTAEELAQFDNRYTNTRKNSDISINTSNSNHYSTNRNPNTDTPVRVNSARVKENATWKYSDFHPKSVSPAQTVLATHTHHPLSKVSNSNTQSWDYGERTDNGCASTSCHADFTTVSLPASPAVSRSMDFSSYLCSNGNAEDSNTGHTLESSTVTSRSSITSSNNNTIISNKNTSKSSHDAVSVRPKLHGVRRNSRKHSTSSVSEVGPASSRARQNYGSSSTFKTGTVAREKFASVISQCASDVIEMLEDMSNSSDDVIVAVTLSDVGPTVKKAESFERKTKKEEIFVRPDADSSEVTPSLSNCDVVKIHDLPKACSKTDVTEVRSEDDVTESDVRRRAQKRPFIATIDVDAIIRILQQCDLLT